MTVSGKLSAAYTRAGFGEAAYQQRLAQHRQQQGGQWVTAGRGALTAGQHILHLLLTVFTAGLWAPVWIVRGLQGNRNLRWEPGRATRPQGPPARQPGTGR
jgi:hypothetical protein